MLTALVLDEITHADTHALGVPLPHADSGDKRLRALWGQCWERRPAPHSPGRQREASERTMARLFREAGPGLPAVAPAGVALAHALPLISRGTPISDVAAASSYASDSAFSAMFKTAMGHLPPRYARGTQNHDDWQALGTRRTTCVIIPLLCAMWRSYPATHASGTSVTSEIAAPYQALLLQTPGASGLLHVVASAPYRRGQPPSPPQ